MPNIEIHGLNNEEGENLRQKIVKLFKTKSWEDEYVVTLIPSSVTDKNSTRQPFIRLVTTPSLDNDAIVAELEKLEIDIELLELKKFIPKQSVVSEKRFIDDSMMTI
jgi:hypothetical protein